STLDQWSVFAPVRTNFVSLERLAVAEVEALIEKGAHREHGERSELDQEDYSQSPEYSAWRHDSRRRVHSWCWRAANSTSTSAGSAHSRPQTEHSLYHG